MKWDWSKFGQVMLKVAQVAPYAVLSAQQLATDNDNGASKMQMAQNSLKVLTGLDTVFADPEHAAIVEQANQFATMQLQTWVDIFKAKAVLPPGKTQVVSGDPMPPKH